MNWNWACEQLLKGEKVRLPDYERNAYLFINFEGYLCSYIQNQIDYYAPRKREFLSTDWELYQEPKKWAEEDIRMAKAGIELNAKYVARDKNKEVWFYTEHPYKDDEYSMHWTANSANCHAFWIGKRVFQSVKWEDEEPTRLQDIANSEVKDEDNG